MTNLYEKAQEAAQYIKDQSQNSTPLLALSLGTGSNKLIDEIEINIKIPYHQIPHFPSTQVASHKNEFVIGTIQGMPVICLRGRIHYYEGWSMKELTFPIRVLQFLGVKKLIMTNASGGLNPNYEAGDIVLVKDHINLLPEHPLRGQNDDRLGIRFPDMSNAYSREMRKKAHEAANEISYKLYEGVYSSLQGPSLETPAEYNWLHILGADLVGMSTVPEVIVANHAGIEVLVFSIVTNVCYPPESISETTVEEVIEVANKAGGRLAKIIQLFLKL